VGFPDRSRADFRNKKGPAGQIRKPASSSSSDCLPPPPFELQYVEGCTAADGKIMPDGFIILPSAGKTSVNFIILFIYFIGTPHATAPLVSLSSICFEFD
jgi:hypothetical protein